MDVDAEGWRIADLQGRESKESTNWILTEDGERYCTNNPDDDKYTALLVNVCTKPRCKTQILDMVRDDIFGFLGAPHSAWRTKSIARLETVMAEFDEMAAHLWIRGYLDRV